MNSSVTTKLIDFNQMLSELMMTACNKSQKMIKFMYVFYFISGIICESTFKLNSLCVLFLINTFKKKNQANPNLN